MNDAALEHTLPSLLTEARALAQAEPVDTSPLRAGPMLFDLEALDRVLVSGRDRVRFLHAMLSNDVQQLVAGGGRWATFNNVKGRTLTDVRLFVIDDDRRDGSILAVLEPGARAAFVDGLDRFVISEKVFFEDAAQALWLVAGAGAEAALTAAGAVAPPSEPFAHVASELGGRPVRLLRLDRSGPAFDDIALWFAPEHADAVLGALGDMPRGDRVLLDAARIEAGQPRFGLDLTEANIPLEAGLKDRAISFTKGCYIGQEVICRIDSMGSPKRRLCLLELTGDQAPAPGTPLFAGPKEIGWTTSAVRSERVGRPVALGYARKRSNDIGTVLTVGTPEGPQATVVAQVGER